ncbi:MAG: OmpA family protein [Flavobacteriales bacterium]
MKQLLLCLFFTVLFGEFSLSQIPERFELTDTTVFVGQKKSLKIDFVFGTPCRSQPEYHYPKEILDSIGDFLKNNPEVSIEIAFHTDQRGSDKANQTLSQRRADNFKEEICRKGSIDSKRIIAKGYGESQPIVELDSISKVGKEEKEILHQQNRRTIITILKNELPPLDFNSKSIEVGQRKILKNTGFYQTSTKDVIPISKSSFDSIIHFLNSNKHLAIEIGCFTDQRSSYSYNLDFSLRKVEAIKRNLMKEGNIEFGRILAKGYGETYPIISEDKIKNAERRIHDSLYLINRRIEVKIINTNYRCKENCINEIYNFDSEFMRLENQYNEDGDLLYDDSAYIILNEIPKGLTIVHSPLDSNYITHIYLRIDSLKINFDFTINGYQFMHHCNSKDYVYQEFGAESQFFRKINFLNKDLEVYIEQSDKNSIMSLSYYLGDEAKILWKKKQSYIFGIPNKQ